MKAALGGSPSPSIGRTQNEQSTPPDASNRDVLAGGRFRPAVFVLWLLAAALLGVVAACMAREVESHVPPLLLLFPILVGVVLGR